MLPIVAPKREADEAKVSCAVFSESLVYVAPITWRTAPHVIVYANELSSQA